MHAASKSRASKSSAKELEAVKSENATLQEEKDKLQKVEAVLVQQLSRLTGQTNEEVNIPLRSMQSHVILLQISMGTLLDH